MSPLSHTAPSPLAEMTHGRIDHFTNPSKPVQAPAATMAVNGSAIKEPSSGPIPQTSPSSQTRTENEYVSKIGILTSSLPMYHNQFMKARKADSDKRRLQEQGEPLDLREADIPLLDVEDPERSTEEQAETARRLKPHSRSTIQLQNITAHAANPESVVLDMRSKSKHKTPRWQFGIRSRNEPVDAIKCLYRALESMGDCQWHVNPPKHPSLRTETSGDGPYPVHVQGAEHFLNKDSNLSESPEKERKAHGFHKMKTNQDKPREGEVNSSSNDVTPTESASEDVHGGERDGDVDPSVVPHDYAPKDPWCIHVRWEKKGMSPPGAITTSSAQSSKVDLISNEGSTRRNSVLGSLASAQGSATSFGATDSTANFNDTACFVYMDLQVYVLEADTYLVDFKSAGYELILGERQVRNRQGEMTTEYIGSGNRKADKDVTSAQPFLDLANKLVIHLAKGAQ